MRWFADIGQDWRYAVRGAWKRPGFTVIAVLTLALGVGSATAVFSIVEAALLRPLPYKDPERLAAVWLTSTREKGLAKIFATHADYTGFRRDARTFSSVSAATWAARTGRVLTGYGTAREVLTIPASDSFFDTLGVQAALGRTFRPEDQGCTLVLAYGFWAGTLGGDASIVGKSLTLDRRPCTVVGVMPEQFRFYPQQSDAWILMGPGFDANQDRLLVGIFARLKPGVTPAMAEAELRELYRSMHSERDWRDFVPMVRDLHGEFTFLAGRTLRTTLLLAFGAVLFVVLIACLNVGNLLGARLAERGREMAVRAALGSGQGRIVRQVLAECLLLSALGMGCGALLALGAVRYFRVASPIELSPGATVQMNLAVMAFSGGLVIATALATGLLPAVHASRADVAGQLKAAGRGVVRGGLRTGKLVIAAEVALSFVLLTGAGLLMVSALRMGSEALGFRPESVLATRVSLPVDRYPAAGQRLLAYERLLERLETVSGVAGVTLGSKVPPEAGGNQVLEVRGKPTAGGGEWHEVGADSVSPAFFDVLGIPLHRGRRFGPQDGADAPPVAIVNDALVEKYFAGVNPLGQQIRVAGGAMPWLTIVGVVGNVKHTELMNEMSWVETPVFYRPLAQEPRPGMQIAARVRGETGLAGREIQRQIAAVDASIPVNAVEPLTGRLKKELAYPRFRATVLGFFAMSALLLSAVGLHGVLSQVVGRRIPEFGLRRAVGAQTADVLWLVVRQGGAPVIAGLAVGVILTLAGSRVLTNLLYGIEAADPRALAAVSAVLLVVAGAAILFPALRAVRVDPVAALREE